MKKTNFAFLLLCTLVLSSFAACSPGYGCSYATSETISDQLIETVTVETAAIAEETICLP